MRILFIHQNFPGQFKHLAPALVELGHQVVAIGMTARKGLSHPYFTYKVKRGSSRDVHPWVSDYETKVLRAEACADLFHSLKNRGFTPDLIFAHPGWGEALLVKEVWPEAKQLHFVEYFYGAQGRDVDFDPEFSNLDFAGRCKLNIKNTNNLLNLQLMDWGVSPTHWQRSTVPEQYHDRISVIHDGIDTDLIKPNPDAVLKAVNDRGESLELGREDCVITFVNRNLEPSRGYHQFMRALPDIMAANKQVKVVIIGADGTSYGAKCEEGTWKAKYLNEVKEHIDLSRIHFLGAVDYQTYQSALQISSAHVYLSYPFVLSWSMIEAMSMGAPLVASDTAPVREVVTDNVNGYLVDFFDPSALAVKVSEVLKTDQTKVSKAARDTAIERYDLKSVCLPAQLSLIERITGLAVKVQPKLDIQRV